MTPELKSKWTTALRSGEYAQGRRLLYNKDSNKYCCLGVLACVAGYADPYQATEKEEEWLSRKTLANVGLSPEAQRTLYNMNDATWSFHEAGKTFPEIADWIDANL